MVRGGAMKKSNLYNGLWALFSVVMVVLLVRYPEQALQAAIEGAAVWWEAVFPALLPFFIVSEIALGTGVVNLLGALLEPLMRPVFNVPGEGAYSVAMGIASGYPLGAKITRGLYEAGDLTKGEAERLVTFSSTANPVFIVGAVAVGMFKSPHAGAAMALVHYTSALLLGFFLSFLEKRPKDKGRPRRKATLHEAWERMINARRKDGRSFGEILGDAVWQSVNSALKIGGFIVFFGVVLRLFEVVGLAGICASILNVFLVPFFGDGLARPLIGGFFEVSSGCKMAAASAAGFIWKMAAANAIIAWSGLSVFGQVASMVKGTNISLRLFSWSRAVHAVLAFFLTPVFVRILPSALPVWTGRGTSFGSLLLFAVILAIGLLSSLIIDTLQKTRITWFKW